MATVKSEIDDLVDDLERHGWRVRHRQKHHLAFPPDPKLTPVPIMMTPSRSSGRWRQNLRSELARRGYAWTAANGTKRQPMPTPRKDSLVMAQPDTLISPQSSSEPTLRVVPDSSASAATRRAYEMLRERIISGELGIGERVPTEQALATQYGVHRNSMRKALHRLDEEGLTWVRHRATGRVVRRRPAVEAPAEPEVEVEAQQDAPVEAVEEIETPAEPEAPKASHDVLAQAREALGTLTSLLSHLIETAERAEGDIAEALTMAQAAEARATAAEGKIGDLEQEAIDARRRAREAESRLTNALAILRGDAA